MDVLSEAWARALSTQSPPAPGVVAAAAAVAALLVVLPGVWPIARHVVTIVHEGAHGLAALLTGRRLKGIRLHSDTSGLTVSAGKPRGPGMIVTAAAGYIGPAVLGLGAASLLAADRPALLLWGLLLVLALLLVQIRNWFGAWSVVVCGVVLFAASWWLPERHLSAFAYLVTWFLLLAAPRPVLELQAQRWRRRARNSDADQLAALTGVPALIWVGLFLLLAVGAAVLGGQLLVVAA